MSEPPGPATPECADAQALAAYWDRSLAASERERLEAHLADCARCQMQLAAIARADESARDETAASRVPWYRRWQFAIPAMAAVAAVLVFIAVRHPANEEAQTDQVVAMAKREAPAAALPMPERAPAPAPPIAAAAPSTPAAPASNEIAMNEERRMETREARARAAVAARSLKEQVPALSDADEESESESAKAPASAPTEAGRVVAIAPAAPSMEAASEANRAMVAAPAAAAGGTSSAFGQEAGGHTAVGAGAGAIAGAAVGHPLGVSAASVAPAPIVVAISTPDRSVTWIVGKNGMVERHDADGAARMQHSGVTTDLTAGAAASGSACWIVGRSGTIIRTTDGGEHWTLITAPATENLAAVSASSANEATITTASGQRFATTDGGSTWRPQ